MLLHIRSLSQESFIAITKKLFKSCHITVSLSKILDGIKLAYFVVHNWSRLWLGLHGSSYMVMRAMRAFVGTNVGFN